jgi:hypothetical protein
MGHDGSMIDSQLAIVPRWELAAALSLPQASPISQADAARTASDKYATFFAAVIQHFQCFLELSQCAGV